MTALSVYSFGEARTANGQQLQFTCRPNEQSTISAFLAEHVGDVSVPMNRVVSLSHGAYQQYSRYDIKQDKYAGSDGESGSCYAELLEIKNPPDGRCGVVIYWYGTNGDGGFSEWGSLADARSAWAKSGVRSSGKAAKECKGFIRFVECGVLRPWFYAIGDEHLVGDYTCPRGLNDHPVYRLGTRFLAYDQDGVPGIKTCLGARLIPAEKDNNGFMSRTFEVPEHYVVYWDDGTVYDEAHRAPWWTTEKYPAPRLIGNDDLWIAEATRQFRLLLAGKTNAFSINFTDGTKFNARIAPSKDRNPCAEGRYRVAVSCKGIRTKAGWADFVPTPEAPDVVAYVTQKLVEQGKTVTRVEILEAEVKPGGKKWAGAYISPPQK
ncbi:MAG TPA: hypothetical protein VHC20_03675 [Candidatus Paceibacterota bacterium]|nr:hypothetical protein [Candidatus Paceibacterota bacterium]